MVWQSYFTERIVAQCVRMDACGGQGSSRNINGDQMTAKQFQNAIDRLGLSQVGAARLVDADPRTGRRWALGEVRVPGCVAILLRLLLSGAITVADIEAAKA